MSFIADTANKVFTELDIPHKIITNIFLLSEWLLIGTYLTKALFRNKSRNSRQAGVALIAVSAVVWILHYGYNEASYSAGVAVYCIYIGLLLACLHKIMRNFEYMQLEKSPFFVFCAVFLLFTSGSIALLGIKRYLDANDPILAHNLWAAHYLLNIFKNGTLAYCIYLLQKQKK